MATSTQFEVLTFEKFTCQNNLKKKKWKDDKMGESI